MIDFTLGYQEGSNKYTWKGKHGNLTFEELQALVFTPDYGRLRSAYGTIHKVFMPRLGFCLKLIDDNSKVYIKENKKSVLIIVDPFRENGLRALEMDNGMLHFGPTYENFYDGASYELEYRLKDSSLYDGKSCSDYNRFNSSYGSCIESIMREKLLGCYGCLPPWFPGSMKKTCETDISISSNDKSACQLLSHTFLNFFLGRDLKIFENCLPPCMKMELRMKSTSHITNGKRYTRLSIFMKSQVVISKDTYSYDIFNLMVDMGSALGLWLGLSVMSILDNIIVCFSWIIQRKLTH